MTLVEVLVALAILSIVAVSIMALITQNTRFIAASEERLVAGILLDNEITSILARTTTPGNGDVGREIEFAGRRWFIETSTDDSGVDGLTRIRVSVRDAQRLQVMAFGMTLKADAQ